MTSAPQPVRAETHFLARPWLLPAALAVGVALAYAGTIGFEFVYDDDWEIVGNPWLTSWKYVPRFFTSHFWGFFSMQGSYWRPLILLLLFVERNLFGLHPAPWHLVNVLLHAGVTACVFLLAQRLTGDRITAALAALVFGLHPALVESVAWVSAVPDMLLAILFVPAFLAFLRWHDTGSRAWLAVSLALYALALLSKEPAILLPAVVFAYTYIYAEQRGWTRVRAAVASVLPYVPLTLLYAAARGMVLHRVTYVAGADVPLRAILTWPSLLAIYLRFLVAPYDVSPTYNLGLITHFSVARVLLPALLPVPIVALLYAWTRRDPQVAKLVGFASAWLVLPLVPAFPLIFQTYYDFVHVRYLYLSCMGFAIMLAVAIRRLPAGMAKAFGLPAAQAIASGALVLLLTIGCVSQQVYWTNDLLLFSQAVKVAPDNPIALTRLAVQLSLRKQYPQAIALAQRAIAVDPANPRLNFTLGYIYFLMGRYADAEPLIARTLVLNPSAADPDQFAYLGIVENKLGNLPKAEWAIREAVRRQPQSERYRYALALVLEQEGKLPEAASEFQATVNINPANADARARLARLANGAGR